MKRDFFKKDCEKIYISHEKYKDLEFLIQCHFEMLNRESLKYKDYNVESIMKLWIENYIEKLWSKWEEEQSNEETAY
ncbi:MAG: hypothetical protein HUJ88_11610 [Fusobacterium necrophorum]|nr:hypothetical protein [Fusobacterium necrophorum]